MILLMQDREIGRYSGGLRIRYHLLLIFIVLYICDDHNEIFDRSQKQTSSLSDLNSENKESAENKSNFRFKRLYYLIFERNSDLVVKY